MKIQPEIFKKYDIRGLATGPDAVITNEVAGLIGQAFGTYLQRVEGLQKVVVGCDNRTTSYDLSQAAIGGLRRSGCDVIEIGMVSTPLLYWHSVTHNSMAGLMVTASHLGPDQNGFKMCIGVKSLYGGQIESLRRIIERGDFAYGTGELTGDMSLYSGYVHDLEKRLKMARPLKVVVDSGNGTGGVFAGRIIPLWGHDLVECLYCEPDGHFPNHQPDPGNPENLKELVAKVREHGADIGLAFDGDADRLGVVDEQGNIIAPDRVVALLAKDMLKRHPGATVIADVSSSQVVFDEVKKAGGVPLMGMTGHSLIKAKMAETGALLAGEISGHIFIGEDYFGFDDAYYVAGRLLQLLAASDQPLSAHDAAMPRLYSTPVYRPHCPYDAMPQIMEQMQENLQGKGEINDIDGLRVQFEHGWGLIRTSNTEPVLSMRFEGQTEADAHAYRDMFFALLKAFPQVELA